MTASRRPESKKSSKKPTPRARRAPLRPTPKPAPSIRSGTRPPVAPDDVRLESAAGTRSRGGGPGGTYWRIFVGDEPAGNIFINVIDEAPVGEHASIQIEINTAWQGRGVGRHAYRLASEASERDVIYAHMRKSNWASRKAAEHAGYVIAEDFKVTQLLMVWNRKKK